MSVVLLRRSSELNLIEISYESNPKDLIGKRILMYDGYMHSYKLARIESCAKHDKQEGFKKNLKLIFRFTDGTFAALIVLEGDKYTHRCLGDSK